MFVFWFIINIINDTFYCICYSVDTLCYYILFVFVDTILTHFILFFRLIYLLFDDDKNDEYYFIRNSLILHCFYAILDILALLYVIFIQLLSSGYLYLIQDVHFQDICIMIKIMFIY